MKPSRRVAIITGSSDGIGKATALLFAKNHIDIVVHGRNRERIDKVVEEVEKLGVRCIGLDGDLTDSHVQDELIATVIREFGSIDILVNNAGGSTNRCSYPEITTEDWATAFSINLDAAFFLCQKALPYMLKAGGGRIVNVSSFAGRQRSLLSGIDYAAAKAGMIGMTRQLAHEVGPLGINVNSVAPGITHTSRIEKLWESRNEDDQDRIIANIPLRRLATSEDIAGPIHFLVSEASSYITGTTIDVNGGTLMV